MRQSFRHYLDTHVDYWVDGAGSLTGDIEIRFGYHFSGEHHVREQVLRIPPAALSQKERELLLGVIQVLVGRIPEPKSVRLPHATVIPRIRVGGFTFVAQDQRQATILPVGRLYYQEIIPELASQVEKQIRLERADWPDSSRHMTGRLRAWVRSRAWQSYAALIAPYLHE
jgi:hypothetical protein